MDVAIVVAIVDAAAAVIAAAIVADVATFVVAAVSKHCYHHFQPVDFAHFDSHWVILLSININITNIKITNIKNLTLKFIYHWELVLEQVIVPILVNLTTYSARRQFSHYVSL